MFSPAAAQLFMAAAIPTFGSLVSLAVTLLLGHRLEGRMDRTAKDRKQFWRILGEHRSRIESLERGKPCI